MRYYKDSSSIYNYRETFWDSQIFSQGSQKLHPFTFGKYSNLSYEGPHIYNLILRNRPYLWQSIYRYIPAKKNLGPIIEIRMFIIGVFLMSTYFHIESRLWKERKWDKEPGEILPLRNRIFLRAYNHFYHVKILPFLYYFGLNIEDVDLNIHVDIQQISIGRLYRRFLCMQYARKMGYIKFRNSNYDFLEISENYGKD
jgi:hypothetical protein